MARFVSFGVIGAVVFAAGLLLQILLVKYASFGPISSYVVQVVISIQVSFFLNRRWTWSDRDTDFFAAWWKFNTSKIIATIINFFMYDGLVRIKVNYLVANLVLTALFTVVNYALSNSWAFGNRKNSSSPRPEMTAGAPHAAPRSRSHDHQALVPSPVADDSDSNWASGLTTARSAAYPAVSKTT